MFVYLMTQEVISAFTSLGVLDLRMTWVQTLLQYEHKTAHEGINLLHVRSQEP
jgi:hypothetical protein